MSDIEAREALLDIPPVLVATALGMLVHLVCFRYEVEYTPVAGVCQVSGSSSVQRFGEKLRILRIKHGLTMQALAARLGTSSGYISNVEHDKVTPSIDFAVKVAQVFQVSTDLLLQDEQELE